MKNYLILSTFIFANSLLAQAGTKNGWNSANNPAKLGSNLEYRFNKLPQAATIDNNEGFGWSGSFWPSEKGGIANRWNSPGSVPFEYSSPGLLELQYMSQERINQLSPAEKFDILNGNYNYPLKETVWKTTKKNAKKDWAGICHGWSMAALNLKEPMPVSVVNKDGIKIGFGSSDVKALLSYYYAYGVETSTVQVGARCFGRLLDLTGKCDGVNPGSLHLSITNLIGIQKKGFIADVDRYKEVWNQAVLSYQYEVVREMYPSEKEISRGIAKLFQVKMSMTYAYELQRYPGSPRNQFEDYNTWEPITGTPFNEKKTKIYDYILELDASGRIIGGSWISDDRPDFLWVKEPQNNFTLNSRFADIQKIYKPIVVK